MGSDILEILPGISGFSSTLDFSQVARGWARAVIHRVDHVAGPILKIKINRWPGLVNGSYNWLSLGPKIVNGLTCMDCQTHLLIIENISKHNILLL